MFAKILPQEDRPYNEKKVVSIQYVIYIIANLFSMFLGKVLYISETFEFWKKEDMDLRFTSGFRFFLQIVEVEVQTVRPESRKHI